MLDQEQKLQVKSIVDVALDKAEGIWSEHRMALDEARIRADSISKRELVQSRIPGHEVVEAGREKVGTFIALVADIRDSSKHLLSAISGRKTHVSELQRVFYETSALLTAFERTIQFDSGSVTEYLGDGLLALFEVNEAYKTKAVRAAYAAAKNCLGDTRDIVNEALEERYSLPPLDIGIGIAMSKAVVALVGIEWNSHPKIIGRCVYYATKLAGGRSEIYVDDFMEAAWPTSEEGKLRFKKSVQRGAEGYLVTRGS